MKTSNKNNRLMKMPKITYVPKTVPANFLSLD